MGALAKIVTAYLCVYAMGIMLLCVKLIFYDLRKQNNRSNKKINNDTFKEIKFELVFNRQKFGFFISTNFEHCRSPPISFMSLKHNFMEEEKMNDYNKNTFLSYIDIVSGDKKYYMRLGNEKIEVSEDVYRICYYSYRKQLRDNYRDQKNGLMSYDQEIENGITLLDCIQLEKDRENTINIDMIMEAIQSLNFEDKNLITDLLINEKKEREVAEIHHLTQQGINRRKKKILKELRRKIKEKI